MNRDQRRTAGKGQDNQRVDVTGLIAYFANGQTAHLDLEKILVVDKGTGRPIFDEVLEPVPQMISEATGIDPNVADVVNKPSQEFPEDSTQSYVVAFDTPEGKMEFVKNGNWSGVRKVLDK